MALTAKQPLYVTRQEAAQLLSVTDQTVSKMIRQGRLTAFYVGRSVRIRFSDVIDAPEPYTVDAPRGDRRKNKPAPKQDKRRVQ